MTKQREVRALLRHLGIEGETRKERKGDIGRVMAVVIVTAGSFVYVRYFSEKTFLSLGRLCPAETPAETRC